MKTVDLNYYFRADKDVLFVGDEDDFIALCSDYFYYEKVAPNIPILFIYRQESLAEETVYWRGVYAITDTGSISGLSTNGRLNP